MSTYALIARYLISRTGYSDAGIAPIAIRVAVNPSVLNMPAGSGGPPLRPGEISLMNNKIVRSWPLLLSALLAASCGGGGSSAIAPTLESITLSPSILRLAPGASEQLTVTATHSDGSTAVLPPSSETFSSSNVNVASVSASGVVTVAANAAIGNTATISATDTASGVTTASAGSAQLTVTTAGAVPTATSVSAAKATVANNAQCGADIMPYYWEIGDQNGPLVSGSQGADSTGAPVLVTTKLAVASASKLLYATYVTQLRGSAAALTSQDTNFLHFTSGYSNMGDSSGPVCPQTLDPDDVNSCLQLRNPQGVLFSAQDPATVGRFYYDSGHMENHASQFTPLGTVIVGSLGKTIAALLSPKISIAFGEPLISGGAFLSSQDYATVLQRILDGTLAMRNALGINPVCTHGANCNAAFSPIPEPWHYSIGHWVEDDPLTNGDGAFSSPGAFGFYPWIDASKTFYGILARAQSPENGEQHGYASAQCGRLIRHAFMTGVEQTQPIPTN